METIYRYRVTGIITSQKLDNPRLLLEIAATPAILVGVSSVTRDIDDVILTFKDVLPQDQLLALETLIIAHSGLPLPTAPAPVTRDGRPKVTLEKTDSDRVTLYSHDWTDPTTWYEKATRVVDETPTADGTFTIYTLAHAKVIDSYHGLLTQEDFLLDAAGLSYRVVVKVNGTTKTEQDPHVGSGGDYTINYLDGKVTFLSALTVNDAVMVTYHYAGSSVFTVKPAPGTALKVDFAEIQFSADVGLEDSAVYQAYGFVQVFAPQYCTVNGGPYPPDTLIPLGNPVIYKTMTDYQADAAKAYPTYPVLGGSGWRGSPQPIVIFDWDYIAAVVLRADYGMEVRVSLQHDKPFTGWYATATFYCLVDPL